jgi:hypothetical protein
MACTEGYVVVGLSTDVELVRSGENLFIKVCGRKYGNNSFTRGDFLIAERSVARDEPAEEDNG